MVERCPRCNLRFERVEGHWLGSLGINVMVSFATLFVVLVIGFVVTYPEPPVGPLIALGLAIALVLPVVFFPFSKTFWTAIDILMRPLEPDEVRPEYRILDRE
jgi:hypothetical protein